MYLPSRSKKRALGEILTGLTALRMAVGSSCFEKYNIVENPSDENDNE